MALAGKGVVVIRFDRPPHTLNDFYDWMIGEHMPERLSVPGFRLGRRFRSTLALRFLTLYEVESMAVLHGGPYLERLNNPTPLTRRTAPQSTHMSRGDCSVAVSLGRSQGGAMCSLDFTAQPGREDALRDYLAGTALPAAMAMRGVLGAHLCVTDDAASRAEVEERKGRDIGVPSWIVLIEGVSPQAVERACDAQLSAPALISQGASGRLMRETWVHEMTLPSLIGQS